jgi:hypothetical protein
MVSMGHYARPDIIKLTVETRPRQAVVLGNRGLAAENRHRKRRGWG